jgi:hypothetical protein
MACRLRLGQFNVGVYLASAPGWLASLDERDNPRFDWQRRSPKTWLDRQRWVSLWPSTRIAGGDVAGMGYAPVQADLGVSGAYEPFSCDGAGTQSIKFVQGRCEDVSGNPIAGATVQGFVTSTDAFTGEVFSGVDGSYAVPTQNPGVAHYVVAYYPGSPDLAGTTVNTLIPANVDGS